MVEILGVGEVLWDLLPGGRKLGGAPCNFVFHCGRLGHAATLVSRIGADDAGRDLRCELASLGIDDSFVQEDEEHPTGTVSVSLEAGQPAYTIHEGVAWDFLALESRLEALLATVRVLCFGTLMQRLPVSRAAMQRLLRLASGQALVICDVNLRQHWWSPEVLESSLSVSRWAKLNDDELRTLATVFGLKGRTESERLGSLRRRFKLEVAALTRGERGALVQADDDEYSLGGEKVEVVDTVGAGDAFTAGLVCGMLEGMEIGDAARLANRYAARVAAAPGGTPLVERPG